MGGFGAATWGALPVVAVVVLVVLVVLRRYSRALDVLALGDETARQPRRRRGGGCSG